MITVIDINLGNTASVCKALKRLTIPYKVTHLSADILSADKLIFPGVGNFGEAMKRLQEYELIGPIKTRVLKDKIPILGICLGMQLFADYGEEGGGCPGLGLIKGEVTFLRSAEKGMSMPHIGWNEVHFNDLELFSSLKEGTCFYFLHSYELVLKEPIRAAYCDYAVDFVAAIQKENIFGVQFHPEKSQKAGLELLQNFCRGREHAAI